MTPSTAPSVELLISPRENRAGPLYPDQAANFDLALRNAGKEVITVNSLQGNLDTPVIRIVGPDGPIGAFTRRIRKAKMVGHGGTVKQKSPSLETLAPGKTGATWVNLLAFHAPLPPGTYSFNVVHALGPSDAKVTSADQKFDIVPVHVADTALGYDSRDRSQSLLVWLAGAGGAPKLRLLVRQSGFTGHGSLHQGGTVFGEFDPGARVAVSQLPWDGKQTAVSWVAVLTKDGKGELLRQASTFPQGAPVSVALGLQNPAPVPRFPHRGNTTVLLATGLSAKGDPVLAGVVVEPQGAKAAWHVPLRALPKLTACTFMSEGGIQVLLVSDDGKQAVARKLEVDETGKVLSPEQDIRTTNNAIVAVATGQRSPQAFFLMLEADRERHGRMALLKVPSKGEAKIKVADLGFPQGWPSIQTPGGPQRQPAKAIRLEQALDGGAWIAITNAAGDLYCGKAEGPLELIREAKGSDLLFPNVVTLDTGVSCFGFTADGTMFTPDSGHGH